VKCPRCQWDNPPEKAFCFKCGAFLFDAGSTHQLASIGSRKLALVLDAVLFIVTLVIGYIIWFFIVARRGQTPGKQLAGIVCIDRNGEVLHLWHMVWREWIAQFLLDIVTGTLFGWLDDLWALCERDRQTLHDKMAGSWVVRAA